MSFPRRETANDDAVRWNRIQAQLERAGDHDPDEPLLVDGLATTANPVESEESDRTPEVMSAPRRRTKKHSPPRPPRAERAAPAPRRRPLPKISSPEVAEKRLPKIRAAAERVKRMKRIAIDPEKTHRRGKVLFDPVVQKFGQVVYSSPGYVRLEMRDGSQSAHGKPPMEDRRNFVLANFDRMSNKNMAEILEISVHTMRRLCHEYGLRRHGSKASVDARKIA